MKARKASDLRELGNEELANLVAETQETLANQRFQNELKQLQDVSYISIIKKDIARMKTILKERDVKI